MGEYRLNYTGDEINDAIGKALTASQPKHTHQMSEVLGLSLDGYATEDFVTEAIGNVQPGGFGLTKVWENPDPSESFGTNSIDSSVDVSVDISDAEHVGIIFNVVKGNTLRSPLLIFPTETKQTYGVVVGALTENVFSRKVTIDKSANLITFGYGSKNGDTMDYYSCDFGIPLVIYTISGSGASVEKVNGFEISLRDTVISISDAAEKPCISVVSYIESTSGYDSVELNTGGENLYTGGDLTFTSSINYEFNPPLPAGTYVFSLLAESSDTDSTICNSSYFDESGSSIGTNRFRRDAQTSYTMTFASPLAKMRFYASSNSTNSTGDTATISNISIRNVRQTLTVLLPETVHSGSYNWTTGVLTADESTYQLAVQRLNLSKGSNTIWSSTGDTEITYIADTKLYVDNRFDQLTNAIISLGGNV